METRAVSISRTIPAPARRIFAALVDPRTPPLLEGSETSSPPPAAGASRLGPGVRFSTQVRLVLTVPVTSTVVEFEEGRRIAWARMGGLRQRFEVEPLDAASAVVTASFDWSNFALPSLVERLGLPQRNLAVLTSGLERLEHLVLAGAGTAPPPGE